MNGNENFAVVSNGDHTDKVFSGTSLYNLTLDLCLSGIKYEPDAPNFTPRITGICRNQILTRDQRFQPAIIRKSPHCDACYRFFYGYETIANGFGFCVTTYMGDGDPLPSFTGEPIFLPLEGGIDNIANTYWAMLNAENRVALVVKFISIKNGQSQIKITNRFTKV